MAVRGKQLREITVYSGRGSGARNKMERKMAGRHYHLLCGSF